ncbi:creatininase family protein [Halopiger goleimassiliensis]|uniref:creatininase family protein n=1 Tax=Halopiger goleimassiliensis TaxID=1293048 RepID=UPI0006777CBF|nr:creatininase family protein [Halopiger goleimassiliensis]
MTGDDAIERPYRLDEMTWRDVEAALEETETLLLPVGSTEQHGHHMPLGVDVFMPEGICERVGERTDCLVAPPVWYGVSPHHTFKPGTFTVESETFQRYVFDICASASEWGVENVLLVNGHYLAQDPELDVVVRELRTKRDVQAFHVPLVSVFEDAANEHRTTEVSFHGSEFETSLMLSLRPDLVRMDEAERVDPPEEALPLTAYDAYGDNRVGWALSATDMERLTEAGNVGDPTAATEETGAKLLENAVSQVTDLVEALEAGQSVV